MAYDDKFEVTGELTECGEFIWLHHATLLNRLRKFRNLQGQKLKVTFTIHRKQRSDRQNRYVWGIVVPIVRSWYKETNGEELTHDEIYTWLRVGLLGDKVVITEVLGTQVLTMKGKRFSKMTTKEFTVAIDTIIQEMALRGCDIPLPNEENFITDVIKDE